MLFATANVITGLEEKSPGFADDYIILCLEGISERNRKALMAITRKIVILPLMASDILKEDKITPYINTVIKNKSLLAFAQKNIFQLLERYRNVLYLDNDLLIQEDISGILRYAPLAWRESGTFLNAVLARKVPPENNVKLPYGGVLRISDELLKYSARQLENISANIATSGRHDEAVWALFSAVNNVPVSPLPAIYNTMISESSSEDAAIVHARGEKKFWKDASCKNSFPAWHRRNSWWIACGGEPYIGKIYNYIKLYDSKNNKVVVVSSDGKLKPFPKNDDLKVTFYGNNSVIMIHEPVPVFKNCHITCGSNVSICIMGSKYIINSLSIMASGKNSKVHIGKNFSIEGGYFTQQSEPDTSLFIGDDCMFSGGIYIGLCDGHKIRDLKTGEVVNKAADIRIGNHVWLCGGVSVLKNSTIPDDCVVGRNTVVAGRFVEEHVVMAGQQARIVRRGVTWER